MPSAWGWEVTRHPRMVLYSNIGCCRGTILKSAAYEISGAPESRTVPIRELVDFEAHPVRLSGSLLFLKTRPSVPQLVSIIVLTCPLAPRTESDDTRIV